MAGPKKGAVGIMNKPRALSAMAVERTLGTSSKAGKNREHAVDKGDRPRPKNSQ
jgi:hypothetical protein